jgi:hypothetical protein
MADNEVQIVISATDNASQVIQAFSRTFDMVTQAVTKTVDAYVDYGTEVKTTSDYLDISTEAASRLIQVGNQAEVGYDTLKLAAKKMATDGIAPSTDALAALSDKFLAISDPLQRTQFLIENFGRGGEEMSKIMVLGGAAIRQMSGDISDSLVVDDKKYAAIQKTKNEEIAFNQSMTGLQYQAAGTLLDIFNAMPKPIQTVVQLMGSVGQSGVLMQFTQLSILFTEMSKAGGLGAIFTSIGTGVKAMAAGFDLADISLAPFIIGIGALVEAFRLFIDVIHDNWGTISEALAIFGYITLGINPSWASGNVDSGPLSVGKILNKINPTGNPLPSHASGGDASGWSWVGEQGPELRYSPPGSHIYSNQQSQAMANPAPFIYAPTISLGNRAEIQKVWDEYTTRTLHAKGIA